MMTPRRLYLLLLLIQAIGEKSRLGMSEGLVSAEVTYSNTSTVDGHATTAPFNYPLLDSPQVNYPGFPYSCGDPPQVSCATVTLNSEYIGGHVLQAAIYSCPDPFMLVGPSTMICNLNLQWEARDGTATASPSCQYNCSAAPEMSGARLWNIGYTQRLPWARYGCEQGYRSAGTSLDWRHWENSCDPTTLSWPAPNVYCIANQPVENVTITPASGSTRTPPSGSTRTPVFDSTHPMVVVDKNYTHSCVHFTEMDLRQTKRLQLTFSQATDVFSATIYARANEIPYSECGEYYTGLLNVTRNNQTCQFWQGKYVENINFRLAEYFPHSTSNRNYCRKPAVTSPAFNTRHTAWCFTERGQDNPEWDYCEIDGCGTIDIHIYSEYNGMETELESFVDNLVLDWSNGQTVFYFGPGNSTLATSMTLEISGLGSGRFLDICEIEVSGRPYPGLWGCTKPPYPPPGLEMTGVTNGSCNHTTGQCVTGTQVEYNCAAGWSRINGDNVITCLDSEQWSNMTLRCTDSVEVLVSLTLDRCEVNQTDTINALQTSSNSAHVHFVVVDVLVLDTAVNQELINDNELMAKLMYEDDWFRSCSTVRLFTAGVSSVLLDCPPRPLTTKVKISTGPSEAVLCSLRVFGTTFTQTLECIQSSLTDYRGHINHAITGEVCDFWSDDPSTNAASPAQDSDNYCRSWKYRDSYLWCFVNNTRQACGVSRCDEICVLPWSRSGSEYVGQLDYTAESTTSYNSVCETWNETYSQGDRCLLPEPYLFPDGVPDHNYCRNPDSRSSGPWCLSQVCSGKICSVEEVPCAVPTCPNTADLQGWHIYIYDSEIWWFFNTQLTECWLYVREHETVRFTDMDSLVHDCKHLCKKGDHSALTVLCHGSGDWYRHLVTCYPEAFASEMPWTATPYVSDTSMATERVISPTTVNAIASDDTSSEVFYPSQTHEPWWMSEYQNWPSPAVSTETSESLIDKDGSSAIESARTHQYMSEDPNIILPSDEESASTVSQMSHATKTTVVTNMKSETHSTTDLDWTETLQVTDQRKSGYSEVIQSTAVNEEQPTSLSVSTVTVTDTTAVTGSWNPDHTSAAGNFTDRTEPPEVTTSTTTPGFRNRTAPGKKQCPCSCSAIRPYPTREETKNLADDLARNLRLDRQHLSSYIRSKTSATDGRASAKGVFSLFGIILIVIFLTAIILPDSINVWMVIGRLYSNRRDNKQSRGN